MEYKFNKEKLNKVLKEFYSLSGITMSVWDTNFNQLTFYPNPMASICAEIKSCAEGKQKCLSSDILACQTAASLKGSYTFTCHAGLVDTVVPVYHDDKLIAYIMFGQLKDSEKTLSDLDNVKNLCKKYGISEKSIEEYYASLPTLQRNQIDALANLFKMCIPYFYISEAITVEQNELASKIAAYLENNITTDLTIDQLCKNFKISVSALYEISHKFFGTSIKDYIITKRIDIARHYLTVTNLSVREISVMTGYNDYNYFIRSFKSRTGYTPLMYRKAFPLNIL